MRPDHPGLTRGGGSGAATLARNTVLNLAGQALPMLVAVAAIPAILAGLGVDRFGILAIAWIAFGLSGLFDLGMGRAVTKFVAEALGRGEAEGVGALVWTGAAVQAVAGGLAALALAASAPFLAARVLVLPPELVTEAAATLRLVALALPAVLVASSFSGALEAVQRFDLVNVVRAPLNALNFLLALLGVSLGLTLPGIVALIVTSRLVGCLAFVVAALTSIPSLRGRPAPSGTAFRKLARFGAWIMASGVTIPLLTHGERLLLATLLSVGALTFYTVPFEVIVRLAVIPASFALTLFPAVSRYGPGRTAELAELLGRTLKFLVLAATPVLAFLALFAHEVLAVWIDPGFALEAALALQLLAVAFFLNALAYVPLTAVQGLGRPDLKVKLDLVKIPVFVGLCLVLIPRGGVAGAALAKLVITVVDSTALFWLAARAGAPPFRTLAGGMFFRAAVASGAFMLAAAAGVLLAPGVTAALALFALLTAGYLAVFWRVATDGTDRDALRLRTLLARGSGAVG